MLRGIFVFLLCQPFLSLCLDNGVALKPPMGWSTWNTFGSNVSEILVRETVEHLISSGMKDAGYEFINVDDGWFHCDHYDHPNHHCYNPEQGRDPVTKKLKEDPNRFPSGMKNLVDWVHSKGLKFGLYLGSGPYTCNNFMGSSGYMTEDANLLAEWEVDFVKMDCCSYSQKQKDIDYPELHIALNKTGRPIVYSCDTDEFFTYWFLWISSGETPQIWLRDRCNMWRTGPDIRDDWFWMLRNGHLNDQWLDYPSFWKPRRNADFSGPGSWADPDILTVGMGLQSVEQYKANFFLWCIMAAPLIAGNDIRVMSPEIRDILTAKEVIAVDQDELGKQGRRIRVMELGQEVYVKEMSDGSKAVLFFAPYSPWQTTICVYWHELGLDNDTPARVRDLWEKRDKGTFTKEYCSAPLGLYGVEMVRIFKL